MAKTAPRYVKNRLARGTGYPWLGTESSTPSGTGSRSLVSLGRVVSNSVLYQSGSAGRAFYSFPSITVPAGKWLCVLVEIIAFNFNGATGATATNAPVKILTAGAAGTAHASINQVAAGGAGWYCVTQQYATTTSSIQVRAGLGLDSNFSTDATIQIGRVFYSIESEERIPDFCWPGYTAAYATTGNAVDANRRVTWGDTEIENMSDRFTVFYAVGDSKSNDVDVEANFLLNNWGHPVYTYAASGQGYDYMVTNISYLQERRINTASVTNSNLWADVAEFPKQPIQPNTLLFLNFGVNDISGSTYTGAEEAANFATLASTLGFDDVYIVGLNPWKAGGNGHITDNGTADAGELAQTLAFNAACKTLCESNGWPYTDIFFELGKKIPGDVEIMADGAGGDPDYTDDGLHPLTTASQVIAGLTATGLQVFKQKNNL